MEEVKAGTTIETGPLAADSSEAIRALTELLQAGSEQLGERVDGPDVMPARVMGRFAARLLELDGGAWPDSIAGDAEHQPLQRFLVDAYKVAQTTQAAGVGPRTLAMTIGNQVPQLFLHGLDATYELQSQVAEDAAAGGTVTQRAWRRSVMHAQDTAQGLELMAVRDE